MIANKKQLGDIFGVTDRTITDWEQGGMPIESRPGRGVSNQYDSAKVIEWRIQRQMSGEKTLSGRERKDMAQAKLYELQLVEKSGLFLLVEDVEFALEQTIAAAKGELRSSALKWKKAIDKKYDIKTDLKFYQVQIDATLNRLATGCLLENDDDEGLNVSQETGS